MYGGIPLEACSGMLISMLIDSFNSYVSHAVCIVCMGPSLTQNQLLNLNKLYNCAVRLVFSLNKSDHITTSESYVGLKSPTSFKPESFYHQSHAARGIMFVPFS